MPTLSLTLPQLAGLAPVAAALALVWKATSP